MQNSGNVVTTQPATSGVSVGATISTSPGPGRKQIRLLAALTGVLVLCFIVPFADWISFSFHGRLAQFYSYMPMMPFVTGYLIWMRREKLTDPPKASWVATPMAAAVGCAIVGFYFLGASQGWIIEDQDYLGCMMLAFVAFLIALGFAIFGTPTMAKVAFPLVLLVFMAPYPAAVHEWLENFFQHTSAAAAQGMLSAVGTHTTRDGIFLYLPTDFNLKVAEECSGIHSTQVLLITSLLAGNLFLSTSWRRWMLALFIVPLAIARNGLRIFFLGEICLHIDRNLINTWVHHQAAGPVFFALSLVPFFYFLIWLRKGENKNAAVAKTAADGPTKP